MKKQLGKKTREHFDRLAKESGEIYLGSATAAGKERLPIVREIAGSLTICALKPT